MNVARGPSIAPNLNITPFPEQLTFLEISSLTLKNYLLAKLGQIPVNSGLWWCKSFSTAMIEEILGLRVDALEKISECFKWITYHLWHTIFCNGAPPGFLVRSANYSTLFHGKETHIQLPCRHAGRLKTLELTADGIPISRIRNVGIY